MATFILKEGDFISSGSSVTIPSNQLISIPNNTENNLLSYTNEVFVAIINKKGSDIQTAVTTNTTNIISMLFTLNSFGFDNLPLNIVAIPNKLTKDYILKS